MKPGMIRWKIRPSKNGVGLLRPASSRYSCSPWARPTKFLTVLGAWSGNRVILMSPRLVLRVASMAHILPWAVSRRGGARRHGLAHQRKQGRMDGENDVLEAIGGTVFRTKSTSEQVSDAVSNGAKSAADHAASLKERVTPAAEGAMERATSAATTAVDWAKPHVEHG